jgi:glycosyltransferase involved in cell wall biosynthesis
MKIAVYTISKNEAHHIERWAESAKDADYRLVADTGSTDDTLQVAQDTGCNTALIHVRPWRFDDARNISLAMLPDDIDMCIALDADEVLVEGWREHLEGVPAHVTRPRYKYTWSWNEDGSPGLIYGGDKIHKRFGYRWVHPVHEVITPVEEEIQHWCGLEIHHFPDKSKGRTYLPLLEQAVRERPQDDRNSHYLAREYFFNGDFVKAIEEFKRHISLPTAQWGAEKARSMRYLAQMMPHEAEMWLFRALAEDPNRRETWVDLAMHYYRNNDWNSCYMTAQKALSYVNQSLDYLCEPDAWGYLPWDLAAISAFNIGLYEKAVECGEKALSFLPGDERLKGNLTHYRSKVTKDGDV